VNLSGCFRVFLLYDVAEALDLLKLREILGPTAGTVKRLFPRHTPEYISFENAPVVESCGQITLDAGQPIACSIKYYAYAVVVFQMEIPFEGNWETTIAQAARWIDTSAFEPRGREAVRTHLERVASAVIRPRKDWLFEDYLVVDLQEIRQPGGGRPKAPDLLSAHGNQIAELILGEKNPLSSKEADDVLQASLSYYPSDLSIVGPSAALVYDRPEDADAAIQILEYARMQLLEFRYYDDLMSRLLSEVYITLEQTQNVLISRWSLPRQAKRLNTIRLDVMDLTERIDNAIKFVSDTFYARLYRLAATRFGVPDYRSLVERKLRTVGELYEFMVDQFNEARSFVVELGIALLCLLDVILLFRGR